MIIYIQKQSQEFFYSQFVSANRIYEQKIGCKYLEVIVKSVHVRMPCTPRESLLRRWDNGQGKKGYER